jgi:hypothetical protein
VSRGSCRAAFGPGTYKNAPFAVRIAVNTPSFTFCDSAATVAMIPPFGYPPIVVRPAQQHEVSHAALRGVEPGDALI